MPVSFEGGIVIEIFSPLNDYLHSIQEWLYNVYGLSVMFHLYNSQRLPFSGHSIRMIRTRKPWSADRRTSLIDLGIYLVHVIDVDNDSESRFYHTPLVKFERCLEPNPGRRKTDSPTK